MRPGGIFFLIDDHPFAQIYDDRRQRLDRVHSYFQRGAKQVPISVASNGETTTQFNHTLGDVLSAIASADLVIQHVHEFPVTTFQRFQESKRDAEGWWRLPPGTPDVPLIFSVRAIRELTEPTWNFPTPPDVQDYGRSTQSA